MALVLLSFNLVEEVVVAWDGFGPGRMRCCDLCTSSVTIFVVKDTDGTYAA